MQFRALAVVLPFACAPQTQPQAVSINPKKMPRIVVIDDDSLHTTPEVTGGMILKVLRREIEDRTSAAAGPASFLSRGDGPNRGSVPPDRGSLESSLAEIGRGTSGVDHAHHRCRAPMQVRGSIAERASR